MQRKTSKALSSLLGIALIFSALTLTACSSSGSNSGVTVKNQGAAQEIDHDVSIEKSTILDIPAVAITADSIAFKNDNLQLNLTLTNKLGTPISVQTGTLGFAANYINNYMMNDGYLNADLEPNESIEQDVTFNAQEMKMFGISQIGEIGLGIRVSDNQDGESYSEWNHDEIYQGIAVIKTDMYDSVDTSTDTYPDAINNKGFLGSYGATMLKFNGENGFEQSGISINSLGLFKNKNGEVSVLAEIQNNTDSLVIAKVSDISIDGEMIYEGNWTGDAIAPGKIAVMDIGLNSAIDASDRLEKYQAGDFDPESMLESENGPSVDLSNVSQVGIEFSVRDADSNTVVSPTELEFNF